MDCGEADVHAAAVRIHGALGPGRETRYGSVALHKKWRAIPKKG